jgi:hypothetical protein
LIFEARATRLAVRQLAAVFKILKYIFFTDSYPLTASSKIQKFKLREEAKTRLTIDGSAGRFAGGDAQCRNVLAGSAAALPASSIT